MDGKELLFKLSDSHGVSGDEYRLNDIIISAFSEYTDEIRKGKLGDVAAIKKGSREGEYKIMVAAHADEVGLIVTDIDERGFIHFTKVAGIDPKTLPAQEVIIHGKREVFGVVGAKPPHVLSSDDMKKAPKFEEMLIDIGMTREESKGIVSVGDFITINRECTSLLSDYVTGKALDDRAAIATMYECAKYLQKIKHSSDVYFVATTMEELGHLGAKTMAHEISPDVGVAIDVTCADKYAISDIYAECGKGVEISLGPNLHPELTERVIKLAEEYNIPYIISVEPGPTGTDAWDIQVARQGIPTILLSIPLRYMHTSTEVINYRDVVEAGKLLALFISCVREWGDIYA